MSARKSDVFLGGLAAALGVSVLLYIHSCLAAGDRASALEIRAALVKQYDLTDLCLFTDASYARNPVLTDFITPFQDHPMSLEHFPSGSILSPPARRNHGLP